MRSILAVFRFEWKRSATTPRMLTMVGLACFPAAIVALLRFGLPSDDAEISDLRSWRTLIVFYYTIPGVVCMLGSLMWATPVVFAELEGRTWGYLAVRPNTVVTVLAGKYLNACAWTIPAALLSVTLCMMLSGSREFVVPWAVFSALAILSTMAYTALYVFIGVVFLKRAMVVGVAYTVGMEVLVSWVPATINQFTIQYRLRTMLVKWMGVESQWQQLLYDENGIWLQITILVVGSAILVASAMFILRQRELVKGDQE